jgi:membrane protein implicated in regulation of membrane protease activity
LVIPGFFIFFFGLGAWVTALVCLIGNPGTNLQIVIFAVSSTLLLLALRRIIQKKFLNSKSTQSDDVEDEFTGKEALATVDFGGMKHGKVEFKGTTWTAESESEIKEGQRVIIIEKDSFKLIVEPKK